MGHCQVLVMYTTLIKNQEEEGLGSAGKELAESSLAVLYEQNEGRRHVRPEHKGAGEGKRLFLIGKTKGTREGPMEFHLVYRKTKECPWGWSMEYCSKTCPMATPRCMYIHP